MTMILRAACAFPQALAADLTDIFLSVPGEHKTPAGRQGVENIPGTLSRREGQRHTMTNQPATPDPVPALRTHHHHVLTVRSTLSTAGASRRSRRAFSPACAPASSWRAIRCRCAASRPWQSPSSSPARRPCTTSSTRAHCRRTPWAWTCRACRWRSGRRAWRRNRALFRLFSP